MALMGFYRSAPRTIPVDLLYLSAKNQILWSLKMTHSSTCAALSLASLISAVLSLASPLWVQQAYSIAHLRCLLARKADLDLSQPELISGHTTDTFMILTVKCLIRELVPMIPTSPRNGQHDNWLVSELSRARMQDLYTVPAS